MKKEGFSLPGHLTASTVETEMKIFARTCRNFVAIFTQDVVIASAIIAAWVRVLGLLIQD